MSGLEEFFGNKYLMGALFSAFLAQLFKVLINYMLEKRWNWRLINRSGGMPSSHSSTMVTLTVLLARYSGLGSKEFAIAAVLTGIVMYDASGVRRAAGDQAKILNYIIFQLPDLKELQIQQLKEIIGHTPIEVLAGAFLGLIVGFIL